MADDNEPVETNHQADAEGAQLAAVSLVGNVRDFFLRNVRENGMKKPWGKLSEKEQEMEINRATERAEQLVRDVVDIVAQGDFPVVHAIIDNFKIKDGEVTITSKGIADDQVLLSLNHAGKKAVKIVVADAQQFDKERAHVAPDPDEPGLPVMDDEPPAFEDESDEVFDEEAEQEEGERILKRDIPEHDPETGEIIEGDVTAQEASKTGDDVTLAGDLATASEADAIDELLGTGRGRTKPPADADFED